MQRSKTMDRNDVYTGEIPFPYFNAHEILLYFVKKNKLNQFEQVCDKFGKISSIVYSEMMLSFPPDNSDSVNIILSHCREDIIPFLFDI